MDKLRLHWRRVSAVTAVTLLAGITGLWSGALAAVTQYRTKGGTIYAQGCDSGLGNCAEFQANQSVAGPGKPEGTASAWGDGWGATASFWGGGNIPASSVAVSPSLVGVASADFTIPLEFSSDGSTSAHFSAAEAVSAIRQGESNLRYVDHTNHFILTSHFVGRGGSANGKMAVQLDSGGVFLPSGTPATGWVEYNNSGTVTVQQ